MDDEQESSSHHSSLDIAGIRDAIIFATTAYIRSHRGSSVEVAVFDDDRLLFSCLDLDSLDVMMLAEDISSALNISMELTALIDYPTIGDLSRHIQSLMRGDTSAGGLASPLPAGFDGIRRARRTQVCITGTKNLLPSGSRSKDCVVTVPLERWDVEQSVGVRFGSFLESIDAFDPSPWNLSEGECELMDPQQRLVLESVAELTLDCGWGQSLGHAHEVKHAGMFVGASTSEYQGLISIKGLVQGRVSPYAVTGGGVGVIPGRVSYHLGMEGPSISTDTACSSSLVSLGVAVGMMERGTLNTSFACGCNVMLDKRGFALFQAANMLALDGRCKTLDVACDGFSRGEAIVSFALAAVERASDDCERSLFIIRSVSINQDGRSSRLTSPSGPAQSALIASALRDGIMSPGDVASLMLHGTGTPLGDPIEVGAALKVYSGDQNRSKVLNLGAIKTEVCHSEAAAGSVSLARAVDMGGLRAINPAIHLRTLNDYVVRVWEHNKTQINRALGAAPSPEADDAERAIGVSSFASQGTNCHAVISHPIGCDASSQPMRPPEPQTWIKKSIWILPRLHSRVRLSSSTCNRVDLVLRSALRVDDPDRFLSSFFEASKCGFGILFARISYLGLIGMVAVGTGGKAGDLHVRVDGDAVEAAAVGASASATVSQLFQHHSKMSVKKNGPIGGFLMVAGIDDWAGSTRALLAPSAVAANKKAFTLALARCCGDRAPLGVLKSIGAINLTSHDLGRVAFVSCYPGRCRLLTLDLTDLSFEDGGEITDTQTSQAGMPMEYSRVLAADSPIGHSDLGAHQQGNVSVGSCRVRSRPGLASSESVHVIIALSFMRQAILTAPRIVATRHVEAVATLSTAPCQPLRSVRAEAFERSIDCIAGSSSHETHGNLKYVSEVAASGLRSFFLLERGIPRMHNRSNFPPAPQPIVITGGTGGLGMAICLCFEAYGNPLIISSRSGHMRGNLNGRVASSLCLSGDYPAVFAICKSDQGMQDSELHFKECARPLVREYRLVHAGGVLRDASLNNQNPSMVREMSAPKIAASKILFGKCSDFRMPIKSAYAFSSIAALIHPSGSSTYGAVNAIMESITASSMSTGIEVLSIQWGAWASIGMVSSSRNVERAMKKLGVAMIQPVQGLAAFFAIADRRHATPVLTCVPFVDTRMTAESEVKLAKPETSITKMAAFSAFEDDVVLRRIQQVLTEVLGEPVNNVSESLIHYGADSLCAIDIQQALSEEFGVHLPPTVLFDYPTVRAIASAIHAGAVTGKPPDVYINPSGSHRTHGSSIAILSTILRSPAAEDVASDCTMVAAYERWDVDALASAAPNARFGKFIAAYDLFDSQLFKMTSQEAICMDPQQRILLEDSFAATANESSASSDVGVIVGLSFWDYSTVSEELKGTGASQSHAMKLTGRNLSVASGRISFVHGYQGPSMTIDTACSSSLVAIHTAANMLNYDISAPIRVIVGCAMLSFAPDVMQSLSMASMISDDGRSKTLDRTANGYGRGEATAILTMSKTYDTADLPHFMGNITSSAVNQDGRSASLTAPNGPSQLKLLRQTLIKAEIRPSSVGLHELHGTGTPLGDPIEVVAVANAQQEGLAQDESRPPAMVLAATKTVFGHAEPAAGCIGLYSVLVQMFDRARHPLLHLGSVSTLIEPALSGLDGVRNHRNLVASRTFAPLSFCDMFHGSISAFAFQGTNAHVIVESFLGQGNRRVALTPFLASNAIYRGQRHWYMTRIHPWMYPTIQPGRHRDVLTWIACPWRRVMHTMRQHRVFDRVLLPGMAIFRIMSDIGGMTLEGCMKSASAPFQPSAILLCTSSIRMPVLLREKGSDELLVRFSCTSGHVRIFHNNRISNTHDDRDQVASGTIMTGSAMASRGGRQRLDSTSTLRLMMMARIAKISQSYVASLASNHNRDHEESISEPTIESLDSATHVAAFNEASLGLHVSVPASCDTMNITMSQARISNGLHNRMTAAAVSCDDSLTDINADTSRRIRSYIIQSPEYGERSLVSLHSKTLRAPARGAVEHVVDQREVDSPEAVGIVQCTMGIGKIRLAMDPCSGRSLRRSLAFHQFIRVLRERAKSHGLLNGRDPLFDGQFRVAARELRWSISRSVVLTRLACPPEPMNRPDTSHLSSKMSALWVFIGGTSGIGQALASWMTASRSSSGSSRAELMLVGRRGMLTSSSSASVMNFGSYRVSSFDCSSRTDTSSLIANCEQAAATHRVFVHAAGVILDESFLTSTCRSWKVVFAPKYGGFAALSRSIGPVAFEDILSISTASIDIGNNGQANYVSANLAMEGISRQILHAGIPSRIVRYGPWKSLGMLTRLRNDLVTLGHLSRMGLTLMTPLEGLRATAEFLRSSNTFATTGMIDWDMKGVVVGDHLSGSAATSVSLAETARPQWPRSGLQTFKQHRVVRPYILKQVQNVLGDDTDFVSLDSLSSMEIRNRLSSALNKPLPPTLLFDYPTVDKLVDYLVAYHDSGTPSELQPAVRCFVSGPATESTSAVYISTSSQIVPTIKSMTFEAISDLFCCQKNLQRRVPSDRWDQDSCFSTSGGALSIYTCFATFVDRLWDFDAGLFGMKSHDVQHTDPQARCLLTTTASALIALQGGRGCDHSRTMNTDFQSGEGGVFVGCMFYDYLRSFEATNHGLDPAVVLGNGSPYLSGRLAYVFDLSGPCVGIDTACSSSLVAVHNGRLEIYNKSITFAIACGSNAIILPQTSALICQLGALSKSGRCLSLDAMADGYGRGEAFITLYLSTYFDNDTLAILSATAVNQDGRSISLTAPNGPSQERLITSCLSTGCLRPRDVLTVSIHGTGTLLGDPIETQALSNVFDRSVGRQDGPPVIVVANKSLLGHCEGAAGTTGLINSLFNVKKLHANATHTLRHANPYLVLASLTPRRASGPVPASTSSSQPLSGTSSFGMSGTNACSFVAHYEPLNGVADRDARRLMREQIYPQPGRGGRFAFVPSSSPTSVLLHVTYNQSFSSSLSDHRVRLESGTDGFRPLLAATAQLDVASRAMEELIFHYDRIHLHGVAFLRPSVFVRGNHATFIEINLMKGTVKLSDSVETKAHPHASASIGHYDLRTSSRNNIADIKRSYYGIVAYCFRSEVFRNTAVVSHQGLLSSSMDAALHLSLVGKAEGLDDGHSPTRLPVSCDAVLLDPWLSIMSPGSSVWATDHLLGCVEITSATSRLRMPFIVVGLQSRPLRHLKIENPSSVWMGCVLESLGNRCCGPAYDRHATAGGMDIIGCLGAIQLLQQGHVIELDHKRLPISATKALLRVQANEEGRGAMDVSFTSSSQVVPLPRSERTSNVLLTSLGGIGSLVALYHTTNCSIVRACCRTPAGRRRFELQLEEHLTLQVSMAAEPITVVSHDLSQRDDSDCFLKSSVGVTVHHTAGTLRDALIGNVTRADIAVTLVPKLCVLDNVVSSLDLSAVDTICAYSSISSIFGTRGQAAYAVANAAMDEHARVAWSRGLPCFTIQWGLWEQHQMGMAAVLDHRVGEKLSSLGFLRLSPVEGLAYLEHILARLAPPNDPAIMVTKMNDWAISRVRSAPSMEVSRSTEAHTNSKIIDVAETLRQVFHMIVGETVDRSLPVLQQGLDSVSSIEFTQALERALGVDLPQTLVYDYPLFEDVLVFIQNRVCSAQIATVAEVSATRHAALTPSSIIAPPNIAIVSHISKYPSERITDQQTPFHADGAGILRRSPFHSLDAFACGFYHDELHHFDAELFRLGNAVAHWMDPNIRWLLMMQLDLFGAEITLLNSRSSLDGAGVFLGWMWGHEHGERLEISPNAVTGTSAPFAIGYVAYLMQMCGPCMPVDTACSSSLVALHLATTAITSQECSLASVNGINAFLSVATWLKIRSISAESRDGRCKTLDAAADGYGRGEGFVSMLLSEVIKSEAVSAIVSGSSCLTAGRRSALTAPNGLSQTAVVQDALARAGRPTLDSVALHGTGTSLGDPIEIRSLFTSLQISRCFHLSAPKSAVGHTEGSAGLTNVLSALTTGYQRCITAVHNLRTPNFLLLHDLCGFVARQVGPTVNVDTTHDSFTSHVAGCSSFGMSGVNAHVVLTFKIGSTVPSSRTQIGANAGSVLALSSGYPILVPGLVDFDRHHSFIRWHLTPSFDERRLSWLSDHQVDGRTILPGTFFLAVCEMVGVTLGKVQDGTSSVFCEVSWMRTMLVRDLMQLEVTVSDEGMITCGSAFAASVAKAEMAAPCCPASGNTALLISSRFVSLSLSPPTIIARLSTTRFLTGESRLLAVARADAALHLTAAVTAAYGELFVPASLQAWFSRGENCIEEVNRRDAIRSFALGRWPTVVDDRCIVEACANDYVELSRLISASFRTNYKRATWNCLDVIEEAAGMSYVFEMVADSCESFGSLQTAQRSDSNPRTCSRQISITVERTSFAAHVAAMQTAPLGSLDGGPVRLVGSYSNPTRLLLETHRKETNRGSAWKPAGLKNSPVPSCAGVPGGSGAVSFQRTIIHSPRSPHDAFPNPVPPDKVLGHAMQVKVQSVALNFRDFLVTMGLYPTAGDQASMGSDFAGTVVEIGDKTLHEGKLCIGDAVFGQSKGVFKDRVCVAPQLVAPIPVGVVSPEEASTLSTVFLTAINCVKCVQHQAMLIHAASGGLGFALAQVARARGLNVLATAGSSPKRSYVRSQGVKTMFNSRSHGFVDELISLICTPDLIGLGGIGVVVNTLTSPGMISASQSVLSRGGHFVEVSKREIFSHSRIVQDRPDVQYHIVAVDMIPPEALSDDMMEIASMLARGDIVPAPSVTYSLSQMSRAMNRFRSSLAIGKIVCSRSEDRFSARSRSTWLVTGGAGALGAITCSVLIKADTANLVLPVRRMKPSKSSSSSSNASVHNAIRGSASMVHLFLADVGAHSDFEFLERRKVHGLVHSSGVLRDGLIQGIRSMRPSAEVFASKSIPMLGHLQGSSGTFPSGVELVISFSSVSSVIPNPGQGNYAWANALLDEAAEADARRGRWHVVVNWGPWAGAGMAAHLDERSLRGVRLINPATGAHILEGLLRRAPPAVDRVMCLGLSSRLDTELLGIGLDPLEDRSDVAAEDIRLNWGYSWNRDSVKSAIMDLVAGLLDDVRREALTTDAPLMQAGLDSLGSIELVSGLEKLFNIPIMPTFVFDCPTIDSMVDHIVPLVLAVATHVREEGCEVAEVQHPRVPASNVYGRQNILVLDWVTALPTIGPVPFDRWDRDRSTDWGPPRFGGFVAKEAIETFDHGAFGLSTKESAVIDPQHRILMMQVMEARGECIPHTHVAVGIGRLEDPWHVLHATESLIREGSGLVSTSRSSSASAGRISYHFDFRGGCLAIDTACSSSLVALHVLFVSLAAEYDSCHHGFLCGVNLPMSCRTSAMLRASAMLAADGRCKSLDRSADGYGRSEGSSVMKMSNDESDIDKNAPFVCILGTAVNQDGRSASLTAPNGPAQVQVVRAAIGGTGSRVHVAGMHGTGTPLGDPIEVNALQRVFMAAAKSVAAAITLFASKSSLGHAETASGIFGLVTNIRTMIASSVDGLPSLRSLNRHVIDSVSLTSLGVPTIAFDIPRQRRPCIVRSSQRECPAVTSCASAFAFQGSNASTKASWVTKPYDRDRARTPLAMSVSNERTRVFQLPTGHRLITNARLGIGIAFQCRFLHPALQLLDHRVSAKAIFPASGYVEVMVGAAETLLNDVGNSHIRRIHMLSDIGYKKPYEIDAKGFFLEVAVDAASGRTTVSDGVNQLCSGMTTITTMVANRSMIASEAHLNTDDYGINCARFRAIQRLALVHAQPVDVPGAVAKTSILGSHIVHGMDSAWHLCAFFVALEDQEEINPALRIPRTLGSFYRHGDVGGHRSPTRMASTRHSVWVSLSMSTEKMFKTVSSSFETIDMRLDRVSKASRVVGVGSGAGTLSLPASSVALPLFAIRAIRGDQSINKTYEKSLVRLSESSSVASLLGALKQGVVPDVLPRNPVLQAVLSVADRIQDAFHPTNPTQLMNGISLDPMPERPSVGEPDDIVGHEATILVTGGSGALGSLVRRFMEVLAPGSHVISISRSIKSSRGPSADSVAVLASSVCGDIALDGLCLGSLGASVRRPRKTIVINAAGILIDQPLNEVDILSARSVMAPKHLGTLALTRRSGAVLTAFLHCGSIASILGNKNQASYIIANAILAKLSKKMSEQGVVSVVVHFGPFANLGTGMASSAIQRSLQRRGVPLLSPVDGLRALWIALGDLSCDEYSAFDHTAYFESLSMVSSAQARLDKDDARDRDDGIKCFSRDPTIVSLTGIVHRIVDGRVVSGYMTTTSDGYHLAQHAKFVDFGLDSLVAVEFADALRQEFGLPFTNTVVFDHPTVADLVVHIDGMRDWSQPPVHEIGTSDFGQVHGGDGIENAVCIVAAACRLPECDGDITCPMACWADGDEIQSLVPLTRWDVDLHYAPIHTQEKMYVRIGGWLDGVETFDYAAFGLSRDEGIAMDPQLRLLLELSCELVNERDDVCAPSNTTSNFVGCMYQEYLDGFLKVAGIADTVPSAITSTGMSFLVGRLSYHFNFRGQSIACDTACSSSLVAVHLSREAILRPSSSACEHALAHGVNLMLSPLTTSRICMLHALSPVGRCKTADATADGYGRSESGISVLLAPRDSRAGCGDGTLAVLLGSGIGHNGATGGISAPHGPSQSRLIADVWRESGVETGGAALTSILTSLHGTGTSLGDPIEFQALTAVCSRNRSTAETLAHVAPMPILATKAWAGHMEGTAGLVCLMLPVLESATVAPLVHLRMLNEHIARQGLHGIFVSRQKAPRLPTAMVGSSSFGMGGTNAHTVACTGGCVSEDLAMPISFFRQRCWPLVIQRILPHLLRAVTPKVILIEAMTTHAFWMRDHVIGGKTLVAGATMLSILADIGDHLEALHDKSQFHSRAVTSVVFLKAVEVGPVILVSVERSSGPGMQTVFSMGDSRACMASYDRLPRVSHHARVRWNLGTTSLKPSKALQKVLSTPASRACDSRAPKIVIASIDRPVHRNFASFPPCLIDASMHLGMATGGQGRIPVSISAFVRGDSYPKPAGLPAVSCIIGLKDKSENCIDAHSKAPNATLIDVRSNQLQRTTARYAAVLRARVDEANPMGQISPGSPLKTYIAAESLSVGSTELRTRRRDEWSNEQSDEQPDSWRGLFSALSETVQYHSRSRVSLSTSSVMGSTLLAVARKEYPSLRISGAFMSNEFKEMRLEDCSHMADTEFHSHTTQKYNVVTGAFGGIGTVVSRWLEEQRRPAVLLGRRVPADVSSTLNPSKSAFFTVFSQCDTSSTSDILETLHANNLGFGILHHAAGSVQDALLHRTTPLDIRTTVAGKSGNSVRSAMLDLSMVVGGTHASLLYSSVTGVVGNQGQLAYAYANSLLNKLAIAQNGRGIPTHSIAWGAWAGKGMAYGMEDALAATGVHAMRPTDGLRVLDLLSSSTRGALHFSIIVVGAFDDIDVILHGGGSGGAGDDALIDHVAEAKSATDPVLITRMSSTQSERRRQLDSHIIESVVHSVLNDVSIDINDGETSIVARLDSVQSVVLVDKLSRSLGVQLSPTLVYDYPTVKLLIDHLVDTLAMVVDDGDKEDSDGVHAQRAERSEMNGNPRNISSLALHDTTNSAIKKLRRRFSLKPGYYCSPDIETLSQMDAANICKVPNFIIGRKGYGEIRFLSDVNLTEVDFVTEVHIGKRGMMVSEGAKPGERLNQPALLCFRVPHAKTAVSRRRLRSVMNRKLRDAGPKMVFLDEDTGSVVLFVEDWY